LCELLQCLVEEYRAECAKKEHSAASHISFQDREPRLERTPTTNEMPHLTSRPMPRDAGTSQPTRSVSNSSPPCYIGPQPPQPAPRRCNSQNVEIQDFIKWANLPEMIEHRLIKNGFTTLRTIRCIDEEDVAKLELSLADLCLLRESLTTLRDGRYESYNNSNRSDSGRRLFCLLVVLIEANIGELMSLPVTNKQTNKHNILILWIINTSSTQLD